MSPCSSPAPCTRIIVLTSISPALELIVCTDNYSSDFSSAVTTKKTESGENDRFAFGVSEMQGWRVGACEQPSPDIPFLICHSFLLRSYRPIVSRAITSTYPIIPPVFHCDLRFGAISFPRPSFTTPPLVPPRLYVQNARATCYGAWFDQAWKTPTLRSCSWTKTTTRGTPSSLSMTAMVVRGFQ